MTRTAQLREAGLTAAAGLRRPVPVSFEFFPPGDAAMEQTLWASVQRLAPLAPRFVSVTYGADGSTRERTHNVVMRILRETALDAGAAPDLHRRNAGRDPRDRARLLGRRCAAHRRAARRSADGAGALPSACRTASPTRSTSCGGLRSVGDFDISVAAYPEVHPEAPDPAFDLDNLRAKIDAGATRAITQFFFDTDAFLRFRDRCAQRGIEAQIVPGILPITRFPQHAPIRRALRRERARLAQRALRRTRRRCRDAPADRGERRHRAGAAAAGARRRGVSLLHAEPRRAHLRDLPRARRAARRRAASTAAG